VTDAQERLDNALRDNLNALLDRISSEVAESPCDYAIAGGRYTLTRDGRWMYDVNSAWEQVTVEEIIEDLGLEQFVAELERQVETEASS